MRKRRVGKKLNCFFFFQDMRRTLALRKHSHEWIIEGFVRCRPQAGWELTLLRQRERMVQCAAWEAETSLNFRPFFFVQESKLRLKDTVPEWIIMPPLELFMQAFGVWEYNICILVVRGINWSMLLVISSNAVFAIKYIVCEKLCGLIRLMKLSNKLFF